ncbi:hypothetical protein ACJMK2_018039 [Sinanodonta woodiana]|uniref:Uncharacterized protein n=1 Tax=Sinanodonta woodiana TaxID=1069815 RepID=A0ABD3UC69_SINWO
MAVKKKLEVRQIPIVYMFTIVSPTVYEVLLATYGLYLLNKYGVQRALLNKMIFSDICLTGI